MKPKSCSTYPTAPSRPAPSACPSGPRPYSDVRSIARLRPQNTRAVVAVRALRSSNKVRRTATLPLQLLLAARRRLARSSSCSGYMCRQAFYASQLAPLVEALTVRHAFPDLPAQAWHVDVRLWLFPPCPVSTDGQGRAVDDHTGGEEAGCVGPPAVAGLAARARGERRAS